MIPSLYPISVKPISVLPVEYSLATENPFRNLQRGVDIRLNYLIELDPYDAELQRTVTSAPVSFVPISFKKSMTALGGTNKVYLSDRGFYTEPDDAPPNTSYLPVVNNPFQFDVSILSGEEFRGGLPSFGAIRVKNGSGDFDFFRNYFWSGRTVTIYAGGDNFSRADYEIIFKGTVRDIEYDEDEIIINISDKSAILEKAFSQSIYQGTGGVEGGDNINGDVKPLCYGEVYNVPLKLIDAGTNIYQVHDGSIEEVVNVYDRGVALNDAGDVADITATTVSGGHFKTQLSGGYIRLGGNPDGTITADVKGDNSGGYIDKTGAIISRLLKTKMADANFNSSDIDQGALNALDTAHPIKTGIFIDAKTELNTVINNLTVPLNFYWIFTRQGLFSASAIDEPSKSVLTINESQIIDDSFELVSFINPAWRLKAGYKRNWRVQSLDDLAASTTTAQKEFAIEEYRFIISEDRATRAKTFISRELTFETSLAEYDAAEDYIDRLVRVYGKKRSVYRFITFGVLFKVFVGDTITLKYPRYGLENGADFIIVGISEDAEDEQTTLEVWG